MVAAAERPQVTFAGPTAEVVRDGVVQIAALRRPAAARSGTGGVADLDEVAQGRPRLIAAAFPGMRAPCRLQRFDLYLAEPVRDAGPSAALTGLARGAAGLGRVPAQPWATGRPARPVSVTHQVVAG